MLLITLGDDGVTRLEVQDQKIPICPSCMLPYPVVRFEAKAVPGRRIIGTIHSHAGDGPAAFSRTDQQSGDGLDVLVVGIGTHDPAPSFAVALQVKGHRFPLAIEAVAEGPYRPGCYPCPPEWMERVATVTMTYREVDHECA
ncbi:MAG: hypothetical protein KKI08_00730 [Armatimonadetes bacterium]|nr:hypothetical protein [Armatimonadota bacterium]